MADAPPPPAPCWSSIVQKQAPPPKPPQPPTVDRIVGACKSKQGIAVAVVDANAIIQGGDQLVNLADKIVSVSDVLSEVRDPASRLRLGAMPFEVETMEPDPDALKKVISFSRATGDLQTLSDVDLKLIALTYTLEAQLHGTKHLRDSPPPLHVVNVKRLPEKDMPGWGSNVPNLAEWEALEHVTEVASYSDSRILPLKDLNVNKIPADSHIRSENGSTENGNDAYVDHQENGENLVENRRILPRKKDINIEGKQNVAEEILTSQGDGDNDGDWHSAVSRSTHRKYLRRKARRELSAASETSDHLNDVDMDEHHIDDTLSQSRLADTQLASADIEKEEARVGNFGGEVSIKLRSDSSEILAQKEGLDMTDLSKRYDDSHMVRSCETHEIETDEYDAVESLNTDLDNLDIISEEDFSVDRSAVDDGSSEQSWTIRPLSDSSVACMTGDFAMQNVILQIGLRLLAPGGMQIRQLHRWILKCHACNKVTAEIGRVFCPKCGNGGTLRKVSVTVGENGIILAARRPRISLRGTKFSLPLPQGGRDAITKNLILREDQLPHKVLYPKSKKKSNKQDVDFFSSDDVFSHSADKRTPFQPPLRKALAVFSGRRNPNDNHYSRSKH